MVEEWVVEVGVVGVEVEVVLGATPIGFVGGMGCDDDEAEEVDSAAVLGSGFAGAAMPSAPSPDANRVEGIAARVGVEVPECDEDDEWVRACVFLAPPAASSSLLWAASLAGWLEESDS